MSCSPLHSEFSVGAVDGGEWRGWAQQLQDFDRMAEMQDAQLNAVHVARLEGTQIIN